MRVIEIKPAPADMRMPEWQADKYPGFGAYEFVDGTIILVSGMGVSTIAPGCTLVKDLSASFGAGHGQLEFIQPPAPLVDAHRLLDQVLEITSARRA